MTSERCPVCKSVNHLTPDKQLQQNASNFIELGRLMFLFSLLLFSIASLFLVFQLDTDQIQTVIDAEILKHGCSK